MKDHIDVGLPDIMPTLNTLDMVKPTLVVAPPINTSSAMLEKLASNMKVDHCLMDLETTTLDAFDRKPKHTFVFSREDREILDRIEAMGAYSSDMFTGKRKTNASRKDREAQSKRDKLERKKKIAKLLGKRTWKR